MTLIQSDRINALWNRILIGLAVVLVALAVYLVWLYTRLVSLEHAAAEAERELVSLQTQSSELKEQVFGLFGDEELKRFAATHNLILEREPQYLSYNARGN